MLDKPPGCLQVCQLVKMTLVHTQVEKDGPHCPTLQLSFLHRDEGLPKVACKTPLPPLIEALLIAPVNINPCVGLQVSGMSCGHVCTETEVIEGAWITGKVTKPVIQCFSTWATLTYRMELPCSPACTYLTSWVYGPIFACPTNKPGPVALCTDGIHRQNTSMLKIAGTDLLQGVAVRAACVKAFVVIADIPTCCSSVLVADKLVIMHSTVEHLRHTWLHQLLAAALVLEVCYLSEAISNCFCTCRTTYPSVCPDLGAGRHCILFG